MGVACSAECRHSTFQPCNHTHMKKTSMHAKRISRWRRPPDSLVLSFFTSSTQSNNHGPASQQTMMNKNACTRGKATRVVGTRCPCVSVACARARTTYTHTVFVVHFLFFQFHVFQMSCLRGILFMLCSMVAFLRFRPPFFWSVPLQIEFCQNREPKYSHHRFFCSRP